MREVCPRPFGRGPLVVEGRSSRPAARVEGVPVPRISLLTKPGCHLCDEARAALDAVLAEPEFAAAELGYAETDILGDEALRAEYAEEIPVVLLDDRVHTIWRVEPERLRTALRKALA
ncbi:glutaredoxin family protein [Frigoribacterium sp. CFBP 13729]|nr:glutaredoxin family protein [Frigoribacterium sp. CFBP 13729]